MQIVKNTTILFDPTPLPAGEGQGGGAYIQKKRTTRITRTGLSKNNVNQCPILSNMNKI